MDAIAVKSRGATPTGQTGEAETAIRPGWLAHIEAEPRVRGREAVQRGAVFHKLPSLDKEIYRLRKWPTSHPRMACPVVKSSLGRLQEKKKKTFLPKWSYFRKTR